MSSFIAAKSTTLKNISGMDLGLDDYLSSDDEMSPNNATKNNHNNPNNHDNNNDDDDDDFPVFNLITKSTAPDVHIEMPKATLPTSQRTNTIQTDQKKSLQHSIGRGTYEAGYIDIGEFSQIHKENMKEKQNKIQENKNDERIKNQIKDKFLKEMNCESDNDDEHDQRDNTLSTKQNQAQFEGENTSKSAKLRHINLDAESDDYTGSWGHYDGEMAEKKRVHGLNVAKKQQYEESLLDEYGNRIDEGEMHRMKHEAAARTTSEKSDFYGKVDIEKSQIILNKISKFRNNDNNDQNNHHKNTLSTLDPNFYKTTHSSSSQYIDFKYNTPEYLHSILPSHELFLNNEKRNPEQINKLRSELELASKIRRKHNSDDELRCFDTYNDICLTTVFKSAEKIEKKYNKSNILHTPSWDAVNLLPPNTPPLTNTNPTQPPLRTIYTDPTISSLYSFYEKVPQNVQQLNSKIDREPIFLTDSNFSCQRPHPTSSNYTLSYQLNKDSPNGVGGPVGVSIVKFLPYTNSHLIAGCLDGTAKIYSVDKSVANNYKSSSNPFPGCIRNYDGHGSGLSDLQWVDNGVRFLTSSLDGWTKLWDTETGKVIFRERLTVGKFRGNATPLCSVVLDSNNAVFGCGDGHIRAYDFRDNTLQMEYDQMQTSITTMIPIHMNTSTRGKLMCVSSEGVISVYEKNTPSVLQHVTSDHASRVMITKACIHPSEQFIIANTHSNNAAVFKVDDGGRVKLNRKIYFTGHSTAGFNLGLTCSSDGRYLISGDGAGKVVCWDFKSAKVISQETVFRSDEGKNIKKSVQNGDNFDNSSKSITSYVDWAWNHPSMYVAASWNGSIKIFG